MTAPKITIPDTLKPADGRFGSGPSKVPASVVQALGATGGALLGTSHRQAPVRSLVARIRAGLAELFALPYGYEIVLGNGGSTAFWDAAAFGLIRDRAQFLVCGEFSAKFAAVATGAPFLGEQSVIRSEYSDAPTAAAEPGLDAYAWAQNETSTGVTMPVERVISADPRALMLVDATSAAGAIAIDISQTDAYYFAPQKAFAAEGGLWLAALSPAALERAAELKNARWLPPSLDLNLAISNSRKDQTYNTPAVASLWLLAHQVEWLLAEGGLTWAIKRTEESSSRLYTWAEQTEYTRPYVTRTELRSPVVGTVDFSDAVSAGTVSAVLRTNGIVDVDSYRSLGRNQLRIGMYPAVDPADVTALTACIDYVVEHI